MTAPKKPAAPQAGEPRSNSFHYVPRADVARPPGAACPLRAEPELLARHTQAALPRLIWLRLKDRMRLFHTATQDFDDAEIAATKERLGQVYADVSNKAALDDFARDLLELELDAECASCEKRLVCARCFRRVEGDVFTRDDARVGEILRELRGTVVDLGAGHAPYAEGLEPAAARGELRYLAIEPDAESAARLSAARPWAEVIVAGAEPSANDASRVPDRVDHVLVLRSYNHLRAPELALAPWVDKLAVGGTLLVVDNVAFGVVRSTEHARAAERGPGDFEHFRNDSAAEAEQRLASLGLRLVERREVTPETSNQWLLWYRKHV